MAKKKSAPKKKTIPKKQSPKKQSPKKSKRSITLKKNRLRKKNLNARQSLYSKIYRRKLQLKKVKRKKDVGATANLSSEIIHLRTEVKKVNRKLGVKKKLRPDLQKIERKLKKQVAEEKESDYIIEPKPYTIWEARRHIDKQIWNTALWDYIIIDGKKISTSNPIAIEIAIAEKWADVDSEDAMTISYNPSTKTLRYDTL